jgi:hypothetical protein
MTLLKFSHPSQVVILDNFLKNLHAESFAIVPLVPCEYIKPIEEWLSCVQSIKAGKREQGVGGGVGGM